MKKNLILFMTYLMILTVFGCSKETFTGQTQSASITIGSAETLSAYSCANSTIIKPKVDFLFVIDNSSSATYYFPTDLKAAILNTLTRISDNYDYRVYFAPLMPVTNESLSSYKLLTSNQQYLTTALQSQVAVPSNLSFFGSPSTTPKELGLKRAYDLLTNNIASDELGNNGIFRRQANTVVVMVSSGNDTECTIGTQGICYASNLNDWVTKFEQLTDKYYQGNSSVPFQLRSKNLRFLSVVAKNDCNGFKAGTRYLQLSNALYNYAKGTNDYSTSYDSFNLCSGNFSTIFDELAKSIDVTIQPHTYNYWPVQKNVTNFSFDPSKITVTKIKSDGSAVVVPNDNTNGFTFDPTYYAQKNIRLLPAVSALFPAENYAGFFIQLNGTATVQSPECLIVKTQRPQEFYAYYMLSQEPDLSQTKIYKNGILLDQSATEGWSYDGYYPSLNIKIVGQTDRTQANPGEYKTGYAIKLNGTAVYSNEDTILVIFKAKSL